jgi:hypothetical protein
MIEAEIRPLHHSAMVRRCPSSPTARVVSQRFRVSTFRAAPLLCDQAIALPHLNV